MSTHPLPPPAPTYPRHTSGLAIASLVLGLLYLAGIGSVLAVVFGIQARREIDHSDSTVTGRGLATAGIVLGMIGLTILVLGVIALAAT